MTDTSKEAVDQAREALRKLMEERCTNFDRGAVVYWAERGKYCLTADYAALADKCAALEESLLQANERLLRFEHGLEEGTRERKALEASNERLARDVKGLLDQLAAMEKERDQLSGQCFDIKCDIAALEAQLAAARREALDAMCKVKPATMAELHIWEKIYDEIRAPIETQKGE